MYNLIMDMGTTNTRLSIFNGKRLVAQKKGTFGARLAKQRGKDALIDATRMLINELLESVSVDISNVGCMLVSGMAGSDIGLCEIPHIPLPVDKYILAENISVKHIEAVADFPILFVPGVKSECESGIIDIMRGEECETVGILSLISSHTDSVILLPGTHNKIISVNKTGQIEDFKTTMSGELLDLVVNGSILSGDVSHDFEIVDSEVFRGMLYSKENGVTAALFKIRVMAKNGVTKNALSSFLYGAIIGQDIDLIRKVAEGKKIYVGGRHSLKYIYTLLLGDESVVLDDDVANDAVREGLLQIYSVYQNLAVRDQVISAIEREKLIAIIRKPEKTSFNDAVQALCDGGVRLIEVTFDRMGNFPKSETCKLISEISERFDGMMIAGVGSVTTTNDVILAFNAGAKFIISPHTDPEIVALTKKLGMVSIPGVFTPSDIIVAQNAGADFVKLFPADQLSDTYIKAVKAPIPDAKIFAVGGVSSDNAGEFIRKGFFGVGVGSNLYDSNLIAKGEFEALKELAEKFVKAVKI